jgi:hypothetical protein
MNDAYSDLVDCAGKVSRETFEALTVFEREFRRWSARINLATSSTVPSSCDWRQKQCAGSISGPAVGFPVP